MTSLPGRTDLGRSNAAIIVGAIMLVLAVVGTVVRFTVYQQPR